MKHIITLVALVLVLSAGACTMAPRAAAQDVTVTVSLQLFYDQLSPYGSWVEYQNYGYVWIPDVDREFRPYGTDGRWVLTEDGWTWVSNYSWGWAPFHYGRWAYDASYGWLWVPYNEWGPAWVTWRRSEGYYGWAPMGPGVTLDVSLRSDYLLPDNHWTFVRDRDLNRPDVDRYYIDRSVNVTIINTSTVINNTYVDDSRHVKYVAGPAREDVQRVTGGTIRPIAVRENSRPGQALRDDRLEIYRPSVQTNNMVDRKPKPATLKKLSEVAPVSDRKAGERHRQENLPPSRKESPAEPMITRPPDAKPPSEQPRIAAPPAEKRADRATPRPRMVAPSSPKGKAAPPPVLTAPEVKGRRGAARLDTVRQSDVKIKREAQPPRAKKQKEDKPKPS